jgi:hypothetical protein
MDLNALRNRVLCRRNSPQHIGDFELPPAGQLSRWYRAGDCDLPPFKIKAFYSGRGTG